LTSSLPERAATAIAALKFLPPLICNRLLNDVSFTEEYGLKVDTTITIGNNGPSLCQSKFYAAIRSVLSGDASASLTDREDRVWILAREEDRGGLASLILSCDQQQYILPDYSELSGDATTRIRALESYTSVFNLPLGAQQKWSSILETRALFDFEFNELNKDISDSPVNLEQSIRSIDRGDSIGVSTLVPNSRRYFERLVGAYDGSTSIKDYAVGAGRNFFRQLSEWRPSDGFLFGLYLSSHQALTHELKTDSLETEQLIRLYEFLEKYGDPLSKLGALEVGLRILDDRPELEPFLLRLVLQIRDDDVTGNSSQFKLFSALFVLVDGELARTRCLSREPPFYRRLASLAQAALIHRQLIQLDIDCHSFSDFALRMRSEHFYMQSFADMRSEPRWRPEFADAAQVQADFFGRIRFAGARVEASLSSGSEELRDIILGNGETSLIGLCGRLNPLFPGPLDGIEFQEKTLPDEFVPGIEEKLGEDPVDAFSFVPLINLSLIFNVSNAHSRLASQALKRCNYVLTGLKGKVQLLNTLNGLANVAAIARDVTLARDVRILVRRYRSESQFDITLDEAVAVLLVASASHGGIIQWRDYVGEVISELAFGRLNGEEGRLLHSRLMALLHSVPELWVACSRAEAALQVFCYR
jgi:hypothetical protein